MRHWVELGKTLQVGAFAALAVAALRLWRRQGGVAVARLAASFGVRLADVQRGTCVELVLPAHVVRWETTPVGAGR